MESLLFIVLAILLIYVLAKSLNDKAGVFSSIKKNGIWGLTIFDDASDVSNYLLKNGYYDKKSIEEELEKLQYGFPVGFTINKNPIKNEGITRVYLSMTAKGNLKSISITMGEGITVTEVSEKIKTKLGAAQYNSRNFVKWKRGDYVVSVGEYEGEIKVLIFCEEDIFIKTHGYKRVKLFYQAGDEFVIRRHMAHNGTTLHIRDEYKILEVSSGKVLYRDHNYKIYTKTTAEFDRMINEVGVEWI